MAKAVQTYDFNLAAGASMPLLVEGEYFRVQSSTGALDVIVEGLGHLPGLLAGQGLKDTPFKRLVLKDVSGAQNSGVILVAGHEFVDNRTYGVVTLSGAVDLSPASLLSLESIDLNAATTNLLTRPLQASGSYGVLSTGMAANTPVQVFAPAANVNGAILLTASMTDQSGTAQMLTLLSKATAPASVVDGDIYLALDIVNAACHASLSEAQKIPPGHGLYFISSAILGATANQIRNCRYLLL